jgi:hypothetical protein
MSNDAPPGFDPRFDPAFQRGFEGPVPGAPPAKVPRSQPAVVRADESEKAAAEAALTAASDPLRIDRPFTDDAKTRRVNPFLVVLGGLSVALIGGGLWAAQFARESFLTVNLSTDIDYVTLQMVIIFAPTAVALGIATALGLLFILARRWQRRRS